MEVAPMSITFRSLNPGEEEQAVNTLRKGFGAAIMRYFMWRFVDNPLWEYDYSVVGEYDYLSEDIRMMKPFSEVI
jgi:hypothetical protein